MKPRPAARSRQRGVVALVLVAVLLLGGAAFAFSSFNLTTVRVDRDRSTNEALARAKDALIAYAAADTARPGELPCPDVNDDGKLVIGQDIIGSACASLIGRLPWVTLGLPDLRDDAGERLWYTLSNDFHANGPVPLNSDTAYRAANVSLTMTGTAPATNLVAIVFSPGAVLTRTDGRVQTRGCGAACDPRDFLDIASGEDNADANRTFVSAPRSETFNDRLMPVFSDDLMRLVEQRAARELAQHLRNHYDAWMNTLDVTGTKGFYPYAVPFVDPSAPAQAGTNGNTGGLLSLSTAPLTWSNFPPLVAGQGCETVSGGTVLRCRTTIACVGFVCLLGTPISARIENVATRFVDPPLPPAVLRLNGLSIGSSGASWTLNTAARRLEFDYTHALIAAGLLELEVAAPATSAWLATSWLTANNWHQNAGYALSPGYAIDGVDSCGGAAPPCFTVTNTAAPNNDKHAVVVMTGRALPSAAQMARPVAPLPAGLNQFFEGLNADLAPVFESNMRTATFNDTPVAVRP